MNDVPDLATVEHWAQRLGYKLVAIERGVRVDWEGHRGVINGVPIHLSKTELRFFDLLAKEPGHLVTLETINRVIYGKPDVPNVVFPALRVLVNRMRRLFFGLAEIRVERKRGYRLHVKPDHPPTIVEESAAEQSHIAEQQITDEMALRRVPRYRGFVMPRDMQA